MSGIDIPEHIPLAETNYSLQRISPACAVALTDLAMRALDDAVLRMEFSNTLQAYSQSVEASRERLEALYASTPEHRIGYLYIHNSTGQADGMTYVGTRVEGRLFAHDGTVTPFKGINFSSLLLHDARGQGVRTQQGEVLGDLARQLQKSDHPEDCEWNEGIVYTGIRDGNLPSERATARRGYMPMGVLLHDSAYRGWFRPQELHAYQQRHLTAPAE